MSLMNPMSQTEISYGNCTRSRINTPYLKLIFALNTN